MGDELSVPEPELELLTDPVSEAVAEPDPVPETDAVDEPEGVPVTDALTEPVPVVVREGVIVRVPVPDTVPERDMLVVGEVVELTVHDRVAVVVGVSVDDFVVVFDAVN